MGRGRGGGGEEWTDTIQNLKTLYKCIMANTSAICQQTAHTTYQLSSHSCSARAVEKSPTLYENFFFLGGGGGGGGGQRMDH